jgi:hypothetical protein
MKRKRSVNPFAVVKKKRKQRLKKLSLDRSDFAKQIRRFSRKKGKIQVLPNELEWEMFPFKDHINLLVTVTSDLSNRIAVFEEHPSASSVPLLSYEEDL